MKRPPDNWIGLSIRAKATICESLRESREERFGVLEADLEALNGFGQWRDEREEGEYASLLVEARAYTEHVVARIQAIEDRDALLLLLSPTATPDGGTG